jgi:hypothetical protein
MPNPVCLAAKFFLILLPPIVLFYFGQNVSFEAQWPVYKALLNTSLIIFAVTAFRMALVFPEAVLEPSKEIPQFVVRDMSKEVQGIFLSLSYSASTIVAILLVGLFAPLVKQIPIFVANFRLVRGLSYAFLGVVVFSQLRSILVACRPAHVAKQNIDRLESRQEIRRYLLFRTQNRSE